MFSQWHGVKDGRHCRACSEAAKSVKLEPSDRRINAKCRKCCKLSTDGDDDNDAASGATAAVVVVVLACRPRPHKYQ